jgi:hypothetical protein
MGLPFLEYGEGGLPIGESPYLTLSGMAIGGGETGWVVRDRIALNSK